MHVFFSDSFSVCVYVSKFRVTKRYVVIHTLSNIKPVLCWKDRVEQLHHRPCFTPCFSLFMNRQMCIISGSPLCKKIKKRICL